MRWPAVAWLLLLSGSFVGLIVIAAPWWAWLIWFVPAFIMGPASVKAAFAGYVTDEQGIPIEKSAREGVVGQTARWAAQMYQHVRSENPNESMNRALARTITLRYQTEIKMGSRGAERQAELLGLMALQDKMHGLAHMVFLILASEDGILPTSQKARLPLIRVIVEELVLADVVPGCVAGTKNTRLLDDFAALDDLFWPSASILQESP